MSNYPVNIEVTSSMKLELEKRGCSDFGWGKSDSLGESKEVSVAEAMVAEGNSKFP